MIKKLIVPRNFDQLSGVTSSVVEYVNTLNTNLGVRVESIDSLKSSKEIKELVRLVNLIL